MVVGTQRYEAALQNLNELDDPLSVFEEYHNHLIEIHSDKVTVTRLLERATQHFVDDRRYRNDPRYLKLWLSYAQQCKNPESIYKFLAQKCIASDLAGFYEDYALYLEKKGDISSAGEVLRAGVERDAQPKERLLRTFKEFNDKYPRKKIEVAGYSRELIVNGAISFEEAREKGWRKNASILKTTLKVTQQAQPQQLVESQESNFNNNDNIHHLPTSEGDDFLGPINPDDLTSISIYRDNTADLRELASKLPIHDDKEEDNMPLSLEHFLGPKSLNNNRLSLIREESEGCTQASLLIPHLMAIKRSKLIEEKCVDPLNLVTINQEWISQMKRNFIDKSSFKLIPEEISSHLNPFESGTGRELRKDRTIASLNINGHKFFIQKALSRKVLFGFDLTNRFSSQSSEVVIKYDKSCWESIVLSHLSSSSITPKLLNVEVFSDMTVIIQSFSSHITLQLILESLDLKVEGKVYIYWMRNILSCIKRLLQKGVIHGKLSPENILLKFNDINLSSTDGDTPKSVHLVGFSKSLIIEDEEFMGHFDSDLANEYNKILTERWSNLNIWLLDLVAIYSIWNSLPVVSDNEPSSLKVCWKNVTERIGSTLERNSLNRKLVIEELSLIIEIMDEFLKGESLKSPSLKACLEGIEMYFPPEL